MDIYKLTNKINSKVYIGLTVGSAWNRFISHKSDSKTAKKGIDAAIRKYGVDNFTLEVIDTASTLEELNEKEIYWVSVYNSTNPKIGYNQTLGGGGTQGYHHTEESAYKCGASFRGKHRTKTSDQVEKWRQSMLEHGSFVRDQTFKDNISSGLKLAYAEGRRKPNAKGVGGRGPMTEEEKLRNKENQLGKRNMHNDDLKVNLVVYKDEIDLMLANGWLFDNIKNYNRLTRKEAKQLNLI